MTATYSIKVAGVHTPVTFEELKKRRAWWTSIGGQVLKSGKRTHESARCIVAQSEILGKHCTTRHTRCEHLECKRGVGSKCGYFGTDNVYRNGRDPECFFEVVPRKEGVE